MDVEILHNRLAAAEGAVIRIDGRLDALAATVSDPSERLATLEEKIDQCLERMSQSTPLETIAEQIAEAQLRTAEAEAEQAEADAKISETFAETLSEPVTVTEETPSEEETTDEGVSELETEEPESESGGDRKEASPSWLERLLLVK